MKVRLLGFLAASAIACCSCSGVESFVLDRSVMSEAYWDIWNDDVQGRMDRAIDRYRKVDAVLRVDAPEGTTVTVQQVSHAFHFGAQIFNYNQLGDTTLNHRYREMYGTLFNSATVAFYWRTLEPIPGSPRFAQSYEDTEWFWNACPNPKAQPHWRRPPPDPVVDYLKTRRVRIHGHPLVWGDTAWHYPSWIFDDYCPEEEKRALERVAGVKFPTRANGVPQTSKMSDWRIKWRDACRRLYALSPAEIVAIAPTYFKRMEELYEKRVREIADRYGTRVDSWDVVNESSKDYRPKEGIVAVTGDGMLKSDVYGFMPGDYPHKAFRWAMRYLPPQAQLNINDCDGNENFVAQAKDLMEHGDRIDVIGSQMHLFDPKDAMAIAEGTYGDMPEHQRWSVRSYDDICRKFDRLSRLGRPIHLSEITITAAGSNSPRDQMIQANIARNLYRAWFAQRNMNGITWWNVVDDCGAAGEPSYSGLFTRNMIPKPVYHVLDGLINREWKTSLKAVVSNGKVSFRGFRGGYRLTWTNEKGAESCSEIEVSGPLPEATIEPFRQNEKVVCFGDSITHGGNYIWALQLFENLRHPDLNVRFENRGWSGDSLIDGLRRWDWDVKPLRPDRVLMMFGMNDVGRVLYGTNVLTHADVGRRDQRFVTYQTNLVKMCEMIKRDVPCVNLMTPTPFDEYSLRLSASNNPDCNELGLSRIADVARRYAEENGLGYVENHLPMTKLLRQNPDSGIGGTDRVHPLWEGHYIVLANILQALGEQPLVASVTVDARAGTAEVVNARVTDLKIEPGRISFSYHPRALPFPYRPALKKIDPLVRFTERFNQEPLRVRGLPCGSSWRLMSENRQLGVFTASQIEKGINLAKLETVSALRAMKAAEAMERLQMRMKESRLVPMKDLVIRQMGVDPNDYQAACKALDQDLVEQKRSSWHKSANEKWKELKLKLREVEVQCEELRKEMNVGLVCSVLILQRTDL